MWELVINSLTSYGPAAIIAGVLLYILYKILNGFMLGLKEDRDNYMRIITGQQLNQNDQMVNLEESIRDQSTLIAQQGERFLSGINELCKALDSQTAILKEYIINSKS